MIFDLRNFVSDKLLKLKVDVDHVNFDTFREKITFLAIEDPQSSKRKTTVGAYL